MAERSSTSAKRPRLLRRKFNNSSSGAHLVAPFLCPRRLAWLRWGIFTARRPRREPFSRCSHGSREAADLLLIAGDLTDYGLPEEAQRARARAERRCAFRSSRCWATTTSSRARTTRSVRSSTDAGVVVLDGDACEIRGVGIAGVKGFGGGFGKRALGPWGETDHQAVRPRGGGRSAEARGGARAAAHRRHSSRCCTTRPIQQTVEGEPLEIYPFLGSSRLEEPIGRYPVSLVLHGHAHRGQPEGRDEERRAGLQRVDAAAHAHVSRSSRRSASSNVPVGATPQTATDSGRHCRREDDRESPDAYSGHHGTAPRESLSPRRLLHRRADAALERAGIPVSGRRRVRVLALHAVPRDTKDIDIFVQPRRLPARARAVRRASAIETELPFPHWLGQGPLRRALHRRDLQLRQRRRARGRSVVRARRRRANVLGVPVRLCPAEEMIWSKAFIQERERFDGADVLHLLRELGPSLDWPRLLHAVRRLLARAAQPPDPLRLRLSRRAAADSGLGDGGADARGCADEPSRTCRTTSATARCCRASSIWTTSSTGATATRASSRRVP